MQKELPREVSSGLVEGVQETGRAQARAGQSERGGSGSMGQGRAVDERVAERGRRLPPEEQGLSRTSRG